MSGQANYTPERTSLKLSFQKRKSSQYPAATIPECYAFIQLVSSLGGERAAYASILYALHLSSPTTKSFQASLSSSRQFGLIYTKRQVVYLTWFAKRILDLGQQQKDIRFLFREAFKKPPLYQKLIKRFCGKHVPEKETLGNLLVEEYSILPTVKDVAAGCFLKNAEYVGALRQGILHLVLDEKTVQEDGYSFKIPMSDKTSAHIFIPADVTPKDIEYLNLFISRMLPTFIENLEAEL